MIEEQSQASQSREDAGRSAVSDSIILIVDDDRFIRSNLKATLGRSDVLASATVLEADTIQAALAILHHTRVDCVVLDKSLSDENSIANDGIKAIPEILALRPFTQILMFTASREIQDVVEAMKNGAFGYISKDSPGDFLVTQIDKALEIARMRRKIEDSRRGVRETSGIKIFGKSKAIRDLEEKLQYVAESERPVLLLGETGVGKTTIAAAIHEHRKLMQKDNVRPFVTANLSALSENLLERELFGNEKGAYTDAKTARPGLLELANRGTLFIDEIGEISPKIQVSLLKAIEEKRFKRLGGTKDIEVDFKLICATNRNLEQLVEQGIFREDLYMRISTFPIEVPSLSQRKEDIPDLIKHILPKVCEDAKILVDYASLPSDFLNAIIDNPPKGNIRGLDFAISRLLTLSPRDSLGRSVLRRWREVEELRMYLPRKLQVKAQAITLDQLLYSPLDISYGNFPGIYAFMESVRHRIMIDARSKVKNQREMADILKTTKSTITYYLKSHTLKQKRSRASLPNEGKESI